MGNVYLTKEIWEVCTRESKWGCVFRWHSSACCCQQVRTIQKPGMNELTIIWNHFWQSCVNVLHCSLCAAWSLRCYTCWGSNPGSCTNIWECPRQYDRCGITISKLSVYLDISPGHTFNKKSHNLLTCSEIYSFFVWIYIIQTCFFKSWNWPGAGEKRWTVKKRVSSEIIRIGRRRRTSTSPQKHLF